MEAVAKNYLKSLSSQETSSGNLLKIGGLSLSYLRPSASGPYECHNNNALFSFCSTKKWIYAKQVHGSNVIEVDSNETEIHEADALMSKDPHCGLAVFGGDCPGVVIDTKGDYFAAAHCGWRGTAGGVVKNLVEKLSSASESSPDQWSAFIGPGICGDCYEVDEPVIRAHDWHCSAITWEKQGRIGLDIKTELRSQLESLGLLKQNIKVDPCCTYETPGLHSFRKSGKGPNQMLAVYR